MELDFQTAERYKLTYNGMSKYYTRDELCLLIFQRELAYTFTKKTKTTGILELFNDKVEMVFKIRLLSK